MSPQIALSVSPQIALGLCQTARRYGYASVLLGVAEDGHPEDAYFDSWADEKIYFFLTEQEMQSLKVGDVLNDGEDFTIVQIDKVDPTVFEVEYILEECLS